MRPKPHEYGIAAAVFVAGAAVLWLFAETYDPGIESPLSSLRRLRNAVVVQDQAAGAHVVVAYAATSQPAFIAILPEGAGTRRVLGASRLLPEGEAHTFRVPIEGGLVPGFYYAILHRDDGDGLFDPAKDLPARDARGAAAITRFLVTDAVSR